MTSPTPAPWQAVVDAANSALMHLQAAVRRGFNGLEPLVKAVEVLRRTPASPIVPVFVIKGTDLLAIRVIERYHELCDTYALYAQEQEVGKALEEMRAWQLSNPELVHLPDHVHVPVGEAPAEREPSQRLP